MKNLNLLKTVIKEILLNEIDIEQVGESCFTAGSTHVLKTCKIDGDKYYLKFSEESLFEQSNPSLQILIEYLAYRIYGLYSGIKIPKPILVYDSNKKRVGLATSSVTGVGSGHTEKSLLAKMLTQGIYVDIFLANWDVIGMTGDNVLVDPQTQSATRIDPGGSLTFRAQGGRKGGAFNTKVSELETMLKAGSGAGNVYRHANLKEAAKEFLSVDWESISVTIKNVRSEVDLELTKKDMSDLSLEWNKDVDLISNTLKQRYEIVKAHAEMILSQ